jgi:hypothetical protein
MFIANCMESDVKWKRTNGDKNILWRTENKMIQQCKYVQRKWDHWTTLLHPEMENTEQGDYKCYYKEGLQAFMVMKI